MDAVLTVLEVVELGGAENDAPLQDERGVWVGDVSSPLKFLC